MPYNGVMYPHYISFPNFLNHKSFNLREINFIIIITDPEAMYNVQYLLFWDLALDSSNHKESLV